MKALVSSFFSLILFFQSGLSLSVSDLTLEEKVGQLMMAHFHGSEANEEAAQLIQECHIGGIIYYSWANELCSPEQVQNLSRGLQQLAYNTRYSIPLFISADQEGGVVNRLKDGFTLFPGNYALAQAAVFSWGEESAWMIGRELRAVGVNMNLAPVVDVSTNPANPVIGVRAFGSDPREVIKWGALALQGYKRAGVIPVLKHFPGHGDVEVDSHEALPILKRERARLNEVELAPFLALSSEADVIMSAHLLVPALDPKTPVTFSKRIIHDILRDQFHFNGVIMTDSLAMGGALNGCSSVEEAALRSFEAGHDIILVGGKQLLSSQSGLEFNVGDIKRIHRFIVEAVREGKVSEQRIDASVTRILALKGKFGLFNPSPLAPASLKNEVGVPVYRALAQKIAQRALHVVKGEAILCDFLVPSFSTVLLVPDILKDELMQGEWLAAHPQVNCIFYKGMNPDDVSIHQVVSALGDKKKECIFFTINAWRFSGQQKLFNQVIDRSSKIAVIAVRDPLDADCLSQADAIICTYSPVLYSLEAALNRLGVNWTLD